MDQHGHNSWNVAMRQTLDIYASVVVCKSLPGFKTRHDNVDFAIIRENTEGEYSGLEHQSYPGVVESLKVSTRAKAERIARFAFDFAIKNNRKVSTIEFFSFSTIHHSPFTFHKCKAIPGGLGVGVMTNDGDVESDLRTQSQHYETWRRSFPQYMQKNCTERIQSYWNRI